MVAHIEPGAVDRDLSGVFLGECHEVGDALELAVFWNDEDGRVRAPVAERFKGIHAELRLVHDGLGDEMGHVVGGHGQAVLAAAFHDPVPAGHAARAGLVEDDDGLAEIFRILGHKGGKAGLQIGRAARGIADHEADGAGGVGFGGACGLCRRGAEQHGCTEQGGEKASHGSS